MYCYRRCARIVVTCSELRVSIAKELIVRPDSITVIPTCIDPRAFAGVPAERREPAILHIGTASYKNPLATIDAFARMQSKAKLYMTGKPTPAMTALVAQLPAGVAQRIVFPGYIDAAELRRLLGTVRAVSVPSDYNVPVASPTVLESLASGTPVVGSPSISQDVLVGDVNGFRIDPRDPSTAARCYDRLLSDDVFWNSMSTGAVQRARLFDSRAVAAAYEKLALEMPAGPGRRPVS
jgi:glycosyltransferase involved in cell wall biosynthesis